MRATKSDISFDSLKNTDSLWVLVPFLCVCGLRVYEECELNRCLLWVGLAEIPMQPTTALLLVFLYFFPCLYDS